MTEEKTGRQSFYVIFVSAVMGAVIAELLHTFVSNWVVLWNGINPLYSLCRPSLPSPVCDLLTLSSIIGAFLVTAYLLSVLAFAPLLRYARCLKCRNVLRVIFAILGFWSF
jgi:hypothetical protein